MGVLVEGAWRDGELPQETGASGEFRRADSRFRDRITADGSSGFKAEVGRYHLYVAHGCPWAHRTLIYRSLKKLKGAITVAYAIPGLRQQGWMFDDDPAFPDCTPDTVNGFRYLHQAYTASDPRYTGKVTVPTLWDSKTRRIVNNESSEIIRMLNSEFEDIASDGADFYPKPMRAEIDRLNEMIYANVNNGVYRRSRLASVSHAGSLRCRLFLAVSMQQEAHRRLPQSLELHARALPNARHRRDGEGALLRHQLLVDCAAQSHGHHPEGNAGRL